MIDIWTILNIFFIGFYEAVLLLGGIVLWKGGFPPYTTGVRGEGQDSTQIQRYFSYMMLYGAVVVIIDLLINRMLGEHSIAWDYLCVILDCLSMGFVPLQGKVLRQQQLVLKDFAYSFAPVLPLIVATPFTQSTYPSVLAILSILTFLYMVCRNLWEFYILKRWNKTLKNEYSDVEHKDTGWFFRLYIALICMMLLLLPVNIYAGLGWRETLFYIVMSFLFVRFTSHALRQEEFALAIAGEKSIESKESVEDIESVESAFAKRQNAELPSWIPTLEHLMNEDRIYRNPELSLTELAKAVGTNRSYLSKYLNETLSITFYDYVNNARLQEAEMLLQTTDKSQDMIATESGFKSRSTFHKIFRKTHNMSPTEWTKYLLLNA